MGQVACIGEMTNAYKILFRNNRKEQSLAKLNGRYVSNIQMNLKEIGCEEWTRFMLLKTEQSSSSCELSSSLNEEFCK
jgi:hypothetical protein